MRGKELNDKLLLDQRAVPLSTVRGGGLPQGMEGASSSPSDSDALPVLRPLIPAMLKILVSSMKASWNSRQGGPVMHRRPFPASGSAAVHAAGWGGDRPTMHLLFCSSHLMFLIDSSAMEC